MTLVLDLTPEQEQKLRRIAESAGAGAADYLYSLIDDMPLPVGQSVKSGQSVKNMTPAETIAYWRRNNLFGPYGDPALDAPEMSRELRRMAETREWK